LKVRLVTSIMSNGGKLIKLERDGLILDCPHDPDNYCNNGCPACHIHQPLGNLRGHVELKCFPQPVDFEIEEDKQ
jgi:hypothetical protein